MVKHKHSKHISEHIDIQVFVLLYVLEICNLFLVGSYRLLYFWAESPPVKAAHKLLGKGAFAGKYYELAILDFISMP